MLCHFQSFFLHYENASIKCVFTVLNKKVCLQESIKSLCKLVLTGKIRLPSETMGVCFLSWTVFSGWNPNPQSKAVIVHKTTLLWEISPTSVVVYYFRWKWLGFLLCLLASNARLLCTFWSKPANERQACPSNTSFQLYWCPTDFLLNFKFWGQNMLQDGTENRLKKNNRKGWRGLTGKWWDWRWCGVGDFLTRTCLQGWRCSRRDNSGAFSHQPRQPAPNLSECLSSSGKIHETHVRLPLLCHQC